MEKEYKYVPLTVEDIVNLKKGKKVYFNENIKYWVQFDCVGEVKEVKISASNRLWVLVTNIKSLNPKYKPRKTEMKKKVELLFKRV